MLGRGLALGKVWGARKVLSDKKGMGRYHRDARKKNWRARKGSSVMKW